MKRTTILLMALGIAFSWACSRTKESPIFEDSFEGVELTVRASLADAALTKTVIMSNKKIFWTKDDAINLFYGDRSSGKFTSTVEDEPEQLTDFVGTLTVATGTSEEGMGAKAFWGVYPYNENNSCDGTGVTMTLPKEQEGLAGSFADKLNPSVATAPGLDLAFYNVGAPFYFSVTQEGVTSATFRGNNDEDIAGKIHVTMDSNGKPVTEVLEGEKSITLTAPDGGFVPGETYVLVLLPQAEMPNGYTVTFRKENLEAECVVNKSVDFKRAQGREKKNADDGLTYTLNQPNNVIYYTSTDGSIVNPTYYYSTTDEDLFGARIVSNNYSNGIGTIIFDNDVTRIGDHAFTDRSKLTGISLPESIISIGQEAFEGSSLSSIRIPESVVRIDAGAFAICPFLAEFSGKFATKDGRCLIIDGMLYAFAANGITDYVIPSNVTTIVGFTFAYCTNLTSISLPSNLEMIQDYAFYNCPGIDSIYFPPKLREIHSRSFWGCKALKSITLPYNLTFIGESAFASSGVSRVKIEARTPPEGREEMFNSSCSIFVPSQAVNTYQSTKYWRDYSILDDAFWGY